MELHPSEMLQETEILPSNAPISAMSFLIKVYNVSRNSYLWNSIFPSSQFPIFQYSHLQWYFQQPVAWIKKNEAKAHVRPERPSSHQTCSSPKCGFWDMLIFLNLSWWDYDCNGNRKNPTPRSHEMSYNLIYIYVYLFIDYILHVEKYIHVFIHSCIHVFIFPSFGP